jgi:tetratricopeptide (TPR) repeat protein
MFGRVRALLARLAGSPSPSSAAPVGIASPTPTLEPPPAAVDLVVSPAAVSEQATPLPAPAGDQPDRVVAVGLAELAQAQDLLAAGKLARAIGLLEQSLHRYPDAEVATALDELKTIRRARKRLQRHPADPQAHFELGRALFAQELGEEALEHLRLVCRARPTWLEPRLLCAYEWHWRGRWREAEAAYLAVLAIDPAHVVARRGLTAVRLGQTPDALVVGQDSVPPPDSTMACAAG